MQLKIRFPVLLLPIIMFWYQFTSTGGRTYVHVMPWRRDTSIDPNLEFITQVMSTFLTRLLDPCELMRHVGPINSITNGVRINVRYRVTGVTSVIDPLAISSSSCCCCRKQSALASGQDVTLPPTTSCAGPPGEDRDVLHGNLFSHLNYTLTHLHNFLENLVTWKPVVDNDRIGDYTMAFELDARDTGTIGGSLPVWMEWVEFKRERTIELPLRVEDIKLPSLRNLDFYWQAGRENAKDDENGVGTFPDMDPLLRDSLQWVTCLWSAQRDVLASLMANGQETLDVEVAACQGRPWNTRWVILPVGWPRIGVWTASTSKPASTIVTTEKYRGYKWANRDHDDDSWNYDTEGQPGAQKPLVPGNPDL